MKKLCNVKPKIKIRPVKIGGVKIFSGDKDFAQLVDKNVTIINDKFLAFKSLDLAEPVVPGPPLS